MAVYWQLRRILRQRLRGAAPMQPVNYQQMARRRVIVTFVLFFVGWKVMGVTLNDMFSFRVDEKTGEMGYHPLDQLKAKIEEKRRMRDPGYRKEKFAETLDQDKFTLDSD